MHSCNGHMCARTSSCISYMQHNSTQQYPGFMEQTHTLPQPSKEVPALSDTWRSASRALWLALSLYRPLHILNATRFMSPLCAPAMEGLLLTAGPRAVAASLTAFRQRTSQDNQMFPLRQEQVCDAGDGGHYCPGTYFMVSRFTPAASACASVSLSSRSFAQLYNNRESYCTQLHTDYPASHINLNYRTNSATAATACATNCGKLHALMGISCMAHPIIGASVAGPTLPCFKTSSPEKCLTQSRMHGGPAGWHSKQYSLPPASQT